VVLSAVDPEYSDEARRSKYTGIVVVALVVDPSGMPQRVHVVRHLGMGLDEKAIEAVRQYRFKPAEYQGRPVPVEVNIEVNFQIY
jgi:protein TonB